jgi:hypothetical protein
MEFRTADVAEDDRRAAGVAMPVAPFLERVEHEVQLVAGLRHQVLVARRVVGVAAPLDDAGRFELAQPRGQDVPGSTDRGGDVSEARVAVADLAHDQQRVAVAHHRHRIGDRAHPAIQFAIRTHLG